MTNNKVTPTTQNPAQGESSQQKRPPGSDDPPSYGTQSTTYQARPYPDINPYPSIQVFVYQEPTGLRFLRAFFVAIAIWLLFSMLIQSFISLVRWSHRMGTGKYPIPNDITVNECADGSTWQDTSAVQSFTAVDASRNSFFSPFAFPYSSKTSFSLPLSSDALFLLARGPLSSGSVDIVSSLHQKSDIANVIVSVRYFHEEVHRMVKVCSISRSASDNGVGIFTPDWMNHDNAERQLYFETTIVLPEYGRNSTPLLIKKLETDVPNTLHRVEALNTLVHFQTLSLHGSNAPITVKSISATDAIIETSNSPIQGTFNATRRLTITTSNDPITVDVGLESNGETDTIPELDIQTSNGALGAKVSLTPPITNPIVHPSHPKPKNGNVYRVSAKTSNNRLQVDFPTSPPGSILHFTGETSNGAANVALDPAYEGDFSLKTSNHGAQLHERRDVEDPSGKERMRVVVRHRQRNTGYLFGNIKWYDDGGDESRDKGTVTVITSNAPVVLDI